MKPELVPDHEMVTDPPIPAAVPTAAAVTAEITPERVATLPVLVDNSFSGWWYLLAGVAVLVCVVVLIFYARPKATATP